MVIVIPAALVLGAGVFYAAMIVSGNQDDTWPDEMASGASPGRPQQTSSGISIILVIKRW